MFWGAHPAPRFWAVLALGGIEKLLIGIWILSSWSRPVAGSTAHIRPAFAALLVAFLLGAMVHHFFNYGLIRFPRFRIILSYWGLAVGVGLLAVAAVLLSASLAITSGPGWDFWLWLDMLAGLVLPAALLGIVMFLLRGLAFYLRVLPIIGNFLQAAASTGLLFWWAVQIGWMINGSYSFLVSSSAPGWALPPGMETVALVIPGLALLVLIFAWRLPGPQKGPDAIDPPSMVVIPQADIRLEIHTSEMGASISSPKNKVVISRQPFSLAVHDAAGGLLWHLSEDSFFRDILLQKILSIPILYTGNTIKFKWRFLRKPVQRVVDLYSEQDSLIVLMGDHQDHPPILTLRISFYAEDILRIEVLPGSKDSTRRPLSLFNALSIAMNALPGEHYLGFGQRFNRIDQRGQEMYYLVEEGGVGYAGLAPLLKYIFGERGSLPNGEACTGFPVPFGLASRENGPSLGLFWNTYRPSWTKFPPGSSSSDQERMTLTILDDQIDLYLCTGPAPLECIEQYTRLTGRPALPPPWVLLPWKTRTGPVVEGDVFEDLQKFRELDIPLAHVGIEHWQEIRGSYEFSKQWFPHIEDLIAKAHSEGVRITVWHFPYMNQGCATHREGVREGYFLRNRLGLPYQQRIFHGIATVVDYSNPQASAWHEALVADRFYRRGFNGAMTDYAESVPPDAVLYNGGTGLAMRNAYPVLYSQAMQRSAYQVYGDDHLIYTRAGYAGAQRYVNVQWPGDQDTDWDDGDGLPAAVRAMINVSICGFPVHGSDIGGWYDWFCPITTKELFIRWAEVGAHSPLMRAHGGPIGQNREPWKFDEETVAIYRALSKEHVLLFPYLYSLTQKAGATGVPPVRHPALLWPDREELYQVEDAWMLGDALYIAPVVRQGQTQREVILPPGDWWDLTADCPIQGPARIRVEAPLGKTPRFLRRDAILPRFVRPFDTLDPILDEQDRLTKAGSLEDNLEIWLYPGDESTCFTLFDGTRLSYTQGHISVEPLSKRNITWRTFETKAYHDPIHIKESE